MLSIFSFVCWPYVRLLWKKMTIQILCSFYFIFFMFSYVNSLYILHVNPLSDVSFANIFFHPLMLPFHFVDKFLRCTKAF